MKLKKWKVKSIIMGAVAALMIPTSSFAAGGELPSYSMGGIQPMGAGTWDTLGTVYQYYDSQYCESAHYPRLFFHFISSHNLHQSGIKLFAKI